MELIIRNPALPTHIGSAKIFFEADRTFPVRQKENIVLPLRSGNQFVPFKNSTTFLYAGTSSDRYDAEQILYFGGTDEEPFLVRLRPEVGKVFNQEGEDGFLEALKPPIVKRAEVLFMKAARRQGDIFAAPTLFCWKSIQLFAALAGAEDSLSKPEGRKLEPVFGTRHLFTGEALTAKIAYEGKVDLAEGHIVAPDHDDLNLSFPHILAQTAYLWSPKDAD